MNLSMMKGIIQSKNPPTPTASEFCIILHIRHAKAEFNNCFIIHSKYFSVRDNLTSSQNFLKTFACFSALRCFFLQILFKNVHDIRQGIRACLHGGWGPQIGEVTCGGSFHLTCKRDQIKMRDYMDRRVTLPKRVTSPTWGPPPPCKQALNFLAYSRISYAHFQSLRNSASSS